MIERAGNALLVGVSWLADRIARVCDGIIGGVAKGGKFFRLLPHER